MKIFYLNHVSMFVLKVQYLIGEAIKKQSLLSMPRINQTQVGWMGIIDILKSLKEKATLIEDMKSSIFFNVSNDINELEVPPLIKGSMLISLMN